jgi:hypothetical protein
MEGKQAVEGGEKGKLTYLHILLIRIMEKGRWFLFLILNLVSS